LPAYRFDRCALVEVYLGLAQLRNDLLRRVSLPFHRVLLPSRAFRLSYQLVQLQGVIPPTPSTQRTASRWPAACRADLTATCTMATACAWPRNPAPRLVPREQ